MKRKEGKCSIRFLDRASLGAQESRIHPSMQGTQVGSLVWEDPTRWGAAQPGSCRPEPTGCSPWTPCTLNPVLPLNPVRPLNPVTHWTPCAPWTPCSHWTSCTPWTLCTPWTSCSATRELTAVSSSAQPQRAVPAPTPRENPRSRESPTWPKTLQ